MTAVLERPPTAPLISRANPLLVRSSGLIAPAAAANRTLAQCPSFIGARVLRATLVNACGRPVRGPRSQAVSNGFVQVESSPEVQEGQDYSTTRADGGTCSAETGPDTLKWINVSIQFCQVDFELFNLINPTWKRVTNAARTMTTGVRIGESLDSRLGFALELWPRVSGADVGCDDLDSAPEDPDDPIDPVGYFLFPWIVARAPDSWTNNNGTVTFTLRGRTRAGARWMNGPYDVTRDIVGSPAPLLDPIEDGRGSSGIRPFTPDHFHMELVSVTPPQPTCGARPLPPEVTLFQTTAADPFTWTAQVNNSGDPMPNGTAAAVTVEWFQGATSTVDTLPAGSGSVNHTFTTAGLHKVIITSASDDPANPTRRVVRYVAVEVVDSVAVTPTPLNLVVGATQQLTATATVDIGTGTPETVDVTDEATWTVNNGFVHVSATGLATATAAGTSNVTATYKGEAGISVITVTAPPPPEGAAAEDGSTETASAETAEGGVTETAAENDDATPTTKTTSTRAGRRG